MGGKLAELAYTVLHLFPLADRRLLSQADP